MINTEIILNEAAVEWVNFCFFDKYLSELSLTLFRMDNKKNYVLYDGDCGFCNRSVAFILKHEKSPSIHFAPIQSEYTRKLFEKNNWAAPNLSTFYFIEDGKKFERSKAAFEVLKYLKWSHRWLRIFRFIPRKITDWIYDQVAKRRQRISNGFCVMPTPEQRSRFELN